MASTINGTPAVVAGYYQIPVLSTSGKTLMPRYRNVTLPGVADLPTSQAIMQVFATLVADSALAVGPNATVALMNLR